MYEYILFDLDGTLTDPKVGITTCVQYALHALGIEEPDLDALTPFIGPPLKDSFMEFYGLDEEKAELAIEKYRERFRDKGLFENKVYEGIPELIRKLKGNHMKLAVASSKPTVFVHQILEHFEIETYFDVVVGSELDGTRTDKQEVIEEALRQLYGEAGEDEIEKKKRNTVMVGDRKFDVTAAKACELVSVAVSYGYGPADELRIAKPDYTVRSVEELGKVLLRGTEKVHREPPMTKIWFVIFPALVFYFVREFGMYVGLFILQGLSNVLPGNIMETLVLWDETGEILEGVTGNGYAFVLGLAFLVTGYVTWRYFAKEEITKAKIATTLQHSKKRTPALYVCLVLATFGLVLGLNFLFELAGITAMSQAYTDTAQIQYAAAVPVGLLLNGLVVPVAEELIFRGVLFNRLKKYAKPGMAIVLSALIFGIYHQNIVQGSYAFLMGCVIAYFYERSGRFHGAVLVHVISNLTAYLLTVWGMTSGFTPTWPACAIALAVGVGALIYSCKNKVMIGEEA